MFSSPLKDQLWTQGSYLIQVSVIIDVLHSRDTEIQKVLSSFFTEQDSVQVQAHLVKFLVQVSDVLGDKKSEVSPSSSE